MMGMGTRGEPSPHASALAQLTAAMTPSQASTVAALCDLFELLQQSAPLLSAAVKDLRAAEEAARNAAADLEKTIEEHTTRGVALAARASELDQAKAEVTSREAVCREQEAEMVRKQGTFDTQTTMLAARKYELDQLQATIAGERAEFESARIRASADQESNAKALVEETDRQRRASKAAIQAERDNAASDIREMRAKAQAEIMAERESLQAREDKLAAREEAFRSERARFSALLNQ